MLGLALEGGGARGSFHFGAYKALCECGYRFDGIVGTSIGAINGAVIAQGDYEKGLEFWEKISAEDLFDIHQTDKAINKESLKIISEQFKTFISNRGLDTSKMRMLLNILIDEDKLRLSSFDFGIVTVSLSDFKPLELFKEDIPEGKMIEYIMASANLPAFKMKPLDGKYYLDGGFWDGCPSNMLAQRGYDEIVEIRTNSFSIKRKLKKKDIKLTTITPSESLGGILEFKSDRAKHNFNLGYLDTMRVTKTLKGNFYYITPSQDAGRFFELFASLPEKSQISIAKFLNINTSGNLKRIFFEEVIPKIADLLSLDENADYEDIIIGLFEHMAKEREIDRYRELTLHQLINLIKRTRVEKDASILPTKRSVLSSVGRILLKYDKIYDYTQG